MMRILIEVFRVLVVAGALGSATLVGLGLWRIVSAGSLDWRFVGAAGSLLWGLSGLASAGLAATVLHIADQLDAIVQAQTAHPAKDAPPPSARSEPMLRA